MAEKYYGGNKRSYGVIERQDGWIELHVYHDNKDMRRLLQKHTNDPSYFLQRQDTFKCSSIRAMFWLAKVLDDHRSYFKQNMVRIILNPSIPHVAMAVPAVDVSLDGNLEGLFKSALANPVPLFRTAADDPLLAVFDEKGFFLSEEAQRIYDQVKDLPHIYVARLGLEDAYYFGISNQPGGRWKRSHAYHLGGLAYEILGTKRDDDQNHSNWLRAWFEPFEHERRGSHYVIRMREKIIISFVSRPRWSKAELEMVESRLIALARERGLIVLNKKD